MEIETVVRVKEEPLNNYCIENNLQDCNEKFDAIHQEDRNSTNQSTPVAGRHIPEHDENSSYNLDSSAKQTLYMRTGEANIVIVPSLASPINNAFNLSFDSATLNRVDVWHQVMVHHDNLHSKQKILEMFFGSLPLCDFFPVAYRRHINVDFFMIRMCSQALSKLFNDGLKLKSGQLELPLSVRLCAASFQNDQIFPRSTIEEAVKERCDNAMMYGMANLLNLDNFATHPRLEELSINLGNRSQFEAVCSAIAQTVSNASHISTLRLSNNGICHATPLAALKHSQLVSLDLSNNRIKHPSSLRTLKEIPLLELYVKGNNLTEVPDYGGILVGFFPKLLKLDELVMGLTTTTAKGNNDCDEEVELSASGILLTSAFIHTDGFKKYQISPHWHLVTVHHNGVCGKQDILDALFNQMGKLKFFPCYYKTYSKKDEFLVRNCFEALVVFGQQKFKLPVPSVNAVLKLIVLMNVAEVTENHVVPLRKLEHFVMKRFDQSCLDLCSMQEGLNKYKYVDFSATNPTTLAYMLQFAARKFSDTCFVLRLRHNGLRNCQALGNLSLFRRLVSLDLRFNSLSSFADLAGIPQNSIQEVFLDHNPLCSSVSSGVEYIRKIKQYFHNLNQLDGHALVSKQCFTICQNYICTPEAYKFAECFVKHYFSLYDSFQRADLMELYHRFAQFSMTTSFDIDESEPLNSHQQNQVAYRSHSRNLLQFKGSLDLAMAALIVGNERIAYILANFPKTEFDYYSFRIDVPIFTPERVLITIHGRLKEVSDTLLRENGFLGFTRTFYIQPCGKGKGLFSDAIEYKIYNDMLHLYELTEEGLDYLDSRCAEGTTKANETEPIPSDAGNDRENAVIVFKELTLLNRQWCVRFLEESSWNVKVALTVFLKFYESRRIPEMAFVDSI